MKQFERIMFTRGYAILKGRKYLTDVKPDNVTTWTYDPRYAAVFSSKSIAETIADGLLGKEKTLIVIIEICVTEADDEE